MTDRELLEKAAKAPGYQVVRWTDDETALLLYGIQEPWNALNENPHSDCMGDALRLAVKLNIDITWETAFVEADVMTSKNGDWWIEPYGGDMNAATRRAIVRAAAAMADEKE